MAIGMLQDSLERCLAMAHYLRYYEDNHETYLRFRSKL